MALEIVETSLHDSIFFFKSNCISIFLYQFVRENHTLSTALRAEERSEESFPPMDPRSHIVVVGYLAASFAFRAFDHSLVIHRGISLSSRPAFSDFNSRMHLMHRKVNMPGVTSRWWDGKNFFNAVFLFWKQSGKTKMFKCRSKRLPPWEGIDGFYPLFFTPPRLWRLHMHLSWIWFHREFTTEDCPFSPGLKRSFEPYTLAGGFIHPVFSGLRKNDSMLRSLLSTLQKTPLQVILSEKIPL